MDGVLDRCVVSTSGKGRGDGRFWAGQRGGVYERGTDYQVTLTSPPPSSTAITECLDDVGPLEALSKGQGLKAWADPAAREKAGVLRVDRDPGFWTRLLLSPSPEVRKIAAGHVKLPAEAEPIPLDQAMLRLDAKSLQPDIALSILGAGAAARAGLEKAAQEGNERTKANAAALLRLLDAQPSLPEIVRAEGQRPR
jgi:hypothetical protein